MGVTVRVGLAVVDTVDVPLHDVVTVRVGLGVPVSVTDDEGVTETLLVVE